MFSQGHDDDDESERVAYIKKEDDLDDRDGVIHNNNNNSENASKGFHQRYHRSEKKYWHLFNNQKTTLSWVLLFFNRGNSTNWVFKETLLIERCCFHKNVNSDKHPLIYKRYHVRPLIIFCPLRLTQLTAPPYSPASVSHLHQMSQVLLSFYKSSTKNDYRFVVMIDDNRIMMSQVFGFFLRDLSKDQIA